MVLPVGRNWKWCHKLVGFGVAMPDIPQRGAVAVFATRMSSLCDIMVKRFTQASSPMTTHPCPPAARHQRRSGRPVMSVDIGQCECLTHLVYVRYTYAPYECTSPYSTAHWVGKKKTIKKAVRGVDEARWLLLPNIQHHEMLDVFNFRVLLKIGHFFLVIYISRMQSANRWVKSNHQ